MTTRVSLLLLLAAVGCTEKEKGEGPGTDEETGPVDSDGDGLTDDEEAELGTDPMLADSDGDGFDDPTEIEAGTNPLYEYSHTYTGNYNIGYCENGIEDPTGPSGTGSYQSYSWDLYARGDIPDNLTWLDANGEEVSLYSFCGKYIMMTFGAFW